MVISFSAIPYVNALKRTSTFLEASRDRPDGARPWQKGTELISEQLAELTVGGAGAWPLSDRRVSIGRSVPAMSAYLTGYEVEW